jgi:hypothetical protein
MAGVVYPRTCKCMRSDCTKIRKTRGLCYKCYGQLLRQIQAGDVTWGEAEVLGLCLPAKPKQTWMANFPRKGQHEKAHCEAGNVS